MRTTFLKKIETWFLYERKRYNKKEILKLIQEIMMLIQPNIIKYPIRNDGLKI